MAGEGTDQVTNHRTSIILILLVLIPGLILLGYVSWKVVKKYKIVFLYQNYKERLMAVRRAKAAERGVAPSNEAGPEAGTESERGRPGTRRDGVTQT